MRSRSSAIGIGTIPARHLEDLSPSANYRTILDGVSWHHMTARIADVPQDDRCPQDLPSVVVAANAEIGAELKWGFGVSDLG